MDQQATILWIVHRCHRQLYHRKNGLKCCAEFAQNSQKWHAEFANHARRICNFLVQISDVPSHIAGAVCCPVGLCVQTSLDTSVYASAGANGDGTQRPAVCTGETRSLLRGKDMEQADRRRAKLMSIVNYLYLMPLCQHHIASRSVAKIERTRVINARRLL